MWSRTTKLSSIRFAQRKLSAFPKWDEKLNLKEIYAKIGLLGVCEDRNSSFQQGTASAPPLIREEFHCPANNSTSELGVCLYESGPKFRSAIVDFGDVSFESPDVNVMYESIRPIIRKIVKEQGLIPISLGGDHSISYPLTRALRDVLDRPFVIIHFDAHPDIYPDFEGNPSSHASPFARICEHAVDPNSQICSKLISIGIRTATSVQIEQSHKYGTTMITAREFPAHGSSIGEILAKYIPTPTTPVYLSFDIDVLDPAFAPGVSHREPGGLSTRNAIDAIHSIPGMIRNCLSDRHNLQIMTGTIVGADIVEYNPRRDIDRLTATVAAKLLKEIAGKAILNGRS